jgi:hypothetical protein
MLVLALFLCAGGCLWRSYATIMSVHLDVLTQTAEKLCTVVQAGKGPAAEGMAEYVYPAQRGREFLRQFNTYSGRSSYLAFRDFLNRYEALVHDVDAGRAAGRDPQAALPHLTMQCAALNGLAAQIRRQLKQEA